MSAIYKEGIKYAGLTNVFFATYGVSTYSDILAAINAGNAVYVNLPNSYGSNNQYAYAWASSDTLYFNRTHGDANSPSIKAVTVDSSDNWSSDTYSLVPFSGANNEDVVIPGNLYLNGNSTEVGYRYQGTGSGHNCTANVDSPVSGAYVDLPPGMYILNARWVFNSTSSTNCASQIMLGTSTSNPFAISLSRIQQHNSWWQSMNTTCTVRTTQSSTRVYVFGSCSVARSGCSSWIEAVRLV